jgi:hypothetical protein
MVSQDPAIVRRDKAVRITMLLYAPKKGEKSEQSGAPDVQKEAPPHMMFEEDEADE